MLTARVIEGKNVAGAGESSQVREIGDLLSLSRRNLESAAVKVPGLPAMPFKADLNKLWYRQLAYEHDLEMIRQAQEQADLGWILPVAIGAASLLSIFGLNVWKQREESQELKDRMEWYNKLIEDGYSPEEASRIISGGGGFSEILDKIIMLSAIAGGIYLLVKFTGGKSK